MFSRMIGIPLLLAAAIGLPYAATNGPGINSLWRAVAKPSDPGDIAVGNRAAVLSDGWPHEDGVIVHSGQSMEEGNVSLQEALRFDISKEWVYQRWARKSTALPELGLYGIRVALVSGTELQDVAGSLTYLFDQDDRLQQISFRGRTGDTTQLVLLATQRHGLQAQTTAVVGEQLFQVRSGDDVFSELHTRPAPVLRTDSLHESFIVDLELQRPDVATPLPVELLPLPVVEQPATDEKASELADSGGEKSGDEKSWKTFFPRSRVPNEQIESLDKRGRLW